jgi:hypothetical protein
MSSGALACPPVVRQALAALAMAPAVIAVFTGTAIASGVALPDDRGYELVSRVLEPGGESLLDGGQPSFQANATDGDTVDWVALGACCGAGSGGLNTYRSVHGSTGWEVHAITPVPNEQLVGARALQEPRAWSEDLNKTLYSTAASFAPGDRRPEGSQATSLYLQEPDGEMRWISQGPLGEGAEPDSAQYLGATPTLSDIVFSTAERLTSNATGLASSGSAAYLYARDVAREETALVDVNDAGEPISSYGASLGSAPPGAGPLSGSTLNAISADGSKIFFETPPVGVEGITPHLYMRDLADDTTISLDNTASSGTALYQGASSDGSLGFFTSNEGLDGASTADELYEFNTTSQTIGNAPPMIAIPLAGGAGVLGVVAIANDGSHVFFVATTVLAGNRNSRGSAAVVGKPNLYVFDTVTGETRFVATLAGPDVSNCVRTCAQGVPAGLLSSNAVDRPAYPTPTGSALVFTSSASLTSQGHVGSTTLTVGTGTEARTIAVASTQGFRSGETIVVDIGEREEIDTIETINGAMEMTLSAYGPGGGYGLFDEHAAGARIEAVVAEIYRYSSAEESLICVSCTPSGVEATQSANLGEAKGGSYSPDGHPPALSEDGSRVFFDSPDPLAAEAGAPDTSRSVEPTNLYEWEGGRVSLIAGAAAGGAQLVGTTPSGNDVFFSSSSSLVPGAQSGFQHIYDARVGGGTSMPAGPGPCATEACRTQQGSTAFTVPASQTDLEAGPLADSTAPQFTVAVISARQRAALTRSGRLRLAISATAPGAISAVATAVLHGKRTRIASARGVLAKPGKLILALQLSRAARARLARMGRLAIRIEVRYARDGAMKVEKLVLIHARDPVRIGTGGGSS